MRCQRCKKQEGLWKVLNKKTNQEQMICVWCEEPTDTVIEAPLEEVKDKSKPIESKIIIYGRLHLVQKCRKKAICRICSCDILPGNICYNQHVEYENKPFPISSKVCYNCSKELINSGTEVVSKEGL